MKRIKLILEDSDHKKLSKTKNALNKKLPKGAKRLNWERFVMTLHAMVE